MTMLRAKGWAAATGSSETANGNSTEGSLEKLTEEATEPSASDDRSRLVARIAELERERDHLVAVVDILQAVSASPQFAEITQTVARKLGETFGLDRCSVFLAGDSSDVRLVATYEDPSIRNLIVDLARYPELQRAFESGETVFIPDAMSDPLLRSAHPMLAMRNVLSIVVVPIRWRGNTIGAIFLRTERNSTPFSDRDVRFCQVVATLTANALANAHRFDTLVRGQQAKQRAVELQRVSLIAFLRRFLDRYAKSEEHLWSEALLPKAADDELERLVSVAMEVIREEGEG
ncbi:MAG TPA: GAF domain-containing protein [Gemmatimonadaceae bacterium]|nr:GAF domain-containing protein [Gemmatimonadaceae bacterium]